MVTNIPELGVVSAHQDTDEWLSQNNDEEQQRESTCSSSQRLSSRSACEPDDGGVHVFVHPDDACGEDEESEEEVKV